MSKLPLSRQFALLALNGLDSTHMTTAKKAALRCIMAASFLEDFIKQPFSEERSHTLSEEMKKISSASGRKLLEAESSINKELMSLRLMKESANLLACDMNYVTASVTIREYYSEPAEYSQIKTDIYHSLMESSSVTDETICMFWLLRESGCFYDIFTEKEEDHLPARINELYEQSSLAKALFLIVIQRPLEQAYHSFLRKKKEIFSTPFGAGILFACPMLERSQSVFIEVEEWFSNKDKRLTCVMNRLLTMGQEVEVLRSGEVPLLKINNLYYECIPSQVVVKLPIQGVRLRRYIPGPSDNQS